MKVKENLLLLSEEGILNSNNESYPNVPFQDVPVIAGDVYLLKLLRELEKINRNANGGTY